uniref:Uncharacterized protein n=1 Tax=Anguilla anguilla TaxID=7936 RepID=A0A0E9XGT2_ANGAN
MASLWLSVKGIKKTIAQGSTIVQDFVANSALNYAISLITS